jgi:hypothetical protein
MMNELVQPELPWDDPAPSDAGTNAPETINLELLGDILGFKDISDQTSSESACRGLVIDLK